MRRSILVLVALAVSLTACDKALDSLRQAQRKTPPDLFGTTLIADTAREVEAKVGAPLRLLDLEAENGRLSFQVQDPKKPENVDQYELRNGRLEGPHPVQLMGDGNLEENLFLLSEVDLTKIPTFTREALAKLGIEGAKPTSLRIRKEEPSNATKLRIQGKPYGLELGVTLYADSERQKGVVDGNVRFEIVKSIVF